MRRFLVLGIHHAPQVGAGVKVDTESGEIIHLPGGSLFQRFGGFRLDVKHQIFFRIFFSARGFSAVPLRAVVAGLCCGVDVEDRRRV